MRPVRRSMSFVVRYGVSRLLSSLNLLQPPLARRPPEVVRNLFRTLFTAAFAGAVEDNLIVSKEKWLA